MTDAGSGSLGAEVLLSQEQVTAVLANPLPSELLLKGTLTISNIYNHCYQLYYCYLILPLLCSISNVNKLVPY